MGRQATGEAGGSLSPGAHPDGTAVPDVSLQNHEMVPLVVYHCGGSDGHPHTPILTVVPGRPELGSGPLRECGERSWSLSLCLGTMGTMSAGLVTILLLLTPS